MYSAGGCGRTLGGRAGRLQAAAGVLLKPAEGRNGPFPFQPQAVSFKGLSPIRTLDEGRGGLQLEGKGLDRGTGEVRV